MISQKLKIACALLYMYVFSLRYSTLHTSGIKDTKDYNPKWTKFPVCALSWLLHNCYLFEETNAQDVTTLLYIWTRKQHAFLMNLTIIKQFIKRWLLLFLPPSRVFCSTFMGKPFLNCFKNLCQLNVLLIIIRLENWWKFHFTTEHFCQGQ